MACPQRVVYRQIMYYVVIRGAGAGLRGPRVGWSSIARSGQVHIAATTASSTDALISSFRGSRAVAAQSGMAISGADPVVKLQHCSITEPISAKMV